MEKYAVYDRRGELEAVKRGWSWPGFFFNWIWAFVKQMPIYGIALLGGIAVPMLLGETMNLGGELGHRIAHGAPLIVSLIAGGMGNTWRCTELERGGFEFLGTIAAESPEEAVSAWDEEESYLDAGRVPVPAGERELVAARER